MNEQVSFRVAVVQMDPQLGEIAANFNAVLEGIEAAAREGAQLIVFPECALSGYVYNGAAEVGENAIGRDHRFVNLLADRCATLQVHAIVGLLEVDRAVGTLYNSALLVGPSAPAQWYRKCHLPVLGIDRYVAHGSELPVFDLPFARIGVLICYDVRFPEAARSLALRGIDLLVVPTNWPAGRGKRAGVSDARPRLGEPHLCRGLQSRRRGEGHALHRSQPDRRAGWHVPGAGRWHGDHDPLRRHRCAPGAAEEGRHRARRL